MSPEDTRRSTACAWPGNNVYMPFVVIPQLSSYSRCFNRPSARDGKDEFLSMPRSQGRINTIHAIKLGDTLNHPADRKRTWHCPPRRASELSIQIWSRDSIRPSGPEPTGKVASSTIVFQPWYSVSLSACTRANHRTVSSYQHTYRASMNAAWATNMQTQILSL